MTDKRAILERIIPAAVLKALTPAAEQAVSPSVMVDAMIPLRDFPFRVGRETRVKIVDDRVERIERLHGDMSRPNNDLYLVDEGDLLNISREHFQIEQDDDKFYLYDRGSSSGTFVEQRQVGGSASEETIELNDGDTIVIGTKDSPYIFQFIVLEGFEVRQRM